jgi:8-oxo-dGTP pyrophosphatase MutT (NUDIX family)
VSTSEYSKTYIADCLTGVYDRSIARGAAVVRTEPMTAVDDLWYLADEAAKQAAQTYDDLSARYDDVIQFETTKQVSRRRFRTVTERIHENGAPYGAHTLTARNDGALLLVRHEAVGLWVLPGGETDGNESFRAAAERELEEEAGLSADYRGLGMLGRVTFHADGHSTWGVLPLFEARADAVTPTVEDPDGEITDAAWFDELPPDTRDREQLRIWRSHRF